MCVFLSLFLFHLCLTPIQNLCVRSTVWTCARMWFYFVCSSFAKTKRKLLLLKWVSWAGAQWRAVMAATSSASHALIYCSANGKSAYSATIELHQFGYLDRGIPIFDCLCGLFGLRLAGAFRWKFLPSTYEFRRGGIEKPPAVQNRFWFRTDGSIRQATSAAVVGF